MGIYGTHAPRQRWCLYLHKELHDVSLVTLQGQPKVADFDDVVEEIKKLGDLLKMKSSQLDDGLNLLWKNLEARYLVTNERLQQQRPKPFYVST